MRWKLVHIVKYMSTWQLKVKAIHWHSDSTFSNFFSPKTLLKAVWSQISYGTSMGCWDENLFKCSGSHDPTWLPSPYMVKTFKNVLLRNREADDIETWYKASSTQVLPNWFNWWHWADLVHFYDGQICSLMLLQGSKLIQHVVIYFQACSYLMHSSEQYKTNGPLVFIKVGMAHGFGRGKANQFVDDHIHEHVYS